MVSTPQPYHQPTLTVISTTVGINIIKNKTGDKTTKTYKGKKCYTYIIRLTAVALAQVKSLNKNNTMANLKSPTENKNNINGRYTCIYIGMYACMYICMYACMCVCKYVVCICVCLFNIIF